MFIYTNSNFTFCFNIIKRNFVLITQTVIVIFMRKFVKAGVLKQMQQHNHNSCSLKEHLTSLDIFTSTFVL
jgi:hypothetical protein